jgi:hypothetical protein
VGGRGGDSNLGFRWVCIHVLCAVCCVLYTPLLLLLLKITALMTVLTVLCVLCCVVYRCVLRLLTPPTHPPTPCLPQAAVERWGAARLYTQVAADNEVSGVAVGGVWLGEEVGANAGCRGTPCSVAWWTQLVQMFRDHCAAQAGLHQMTRCKTTLPFTATTHRHHHHPCPSAACHPTTRWRMACTAPLGSGSTAQRPRWHPR